MIALDIWMIVMAINTKYTRKEREIALDIVRIKAKQRYHRERWLELDVQLNVLIQKLGGKYGK